MNNKKRQKIYKKKSHDFYLNYKFCFRLFKPVTIFRKIFQQYIKSQ